MLTNPSPVLGTIRTRVVEFATKNRLPAMYANLQFVESGGLMAYAHSSADAYRRAAVYVDKILKGTNPADLPVELPTKVEFIVNLVLAGELVPTRNVVSWAGDGSGQKRKRKIDIAPKKRAAALGFCMTISTNILLTQITR